MGNKQSQQQQKIQHIKTFNDIKDQINSVVISPDDKCIVIGTEDFDILIYGTEEPYPLIKQLNDPTKCIWSLKFSYPNGKYLAAGCEDNNVYIYIISIKSNYLKS